FGLVALAAQLAELVGLVALAAASGPAAIILGALAAAALAYYLFVTLPRDVARIIREQIAATISAPAMLRSLNDSPLLRFSGEGMAETIARKVLQAAIDRPQPLDVPAPADAPVSPAPGDPPPADQRGLDRFYGQTFQIVFVSDKICRVL